MQPSPEPIVLAASADIAIRLADEGVPVRAIARCIKLPSADVYEFLKEARLAGRLIEIPKDDWPPAERKSSRTRLERDVLTIDEGLLQMACNSLFKMTRLHTTVFIALLRHSQATKATLHNAIEASRSDHVETTDPKIVDVTIYHIRKKLREAAPRLNIKVPEITTTWGVGYSFAPGDRENLVSAIGAFIAEPVKVK